MCSGDAALCQIALTTWYILSILYSFSVALWARVKFRVRIRVRVGPRSVAGGPVRNYVIPTYVAVAHLKRVKSQVF